MHYPHYWNDAKAHLSRACPTMAQLIAQYDGEFLTTRGDGYFTLMRSVAGQQISVKAADAIWKRTEAAASPFTPKQFLKLNDDTLRACGLSLQKINYMRNVSTFFGERNITPEYWAERSDAAIIAELTSIKGIGTWTAEMFLIFFLSRPDVFPVKDLGVLKAIDLHYYPTARKRKTPAQYQKLAKKWAPYRSVATWYLWRALDPVPVAY